MPNSVLKLWNKVPKALTSVSMGEWESWSEA